MHTKEIPVVIIGGGPVGLFSSLLLARYGVPSLLVERHQGTSLHPRARGINVRTMELLREAGLEDGVRAAGAALAPNRYNLVVETLAGREI
ncbi:MAG: FAD-dependent monooxygenase, partial [Ktedonobacteraceae bacterium]|nr:FAD-dependent monooxygenase [Ktedonobacteraceae bacterium]